MPKELVYGTVNAEPHVGSGVEIGWGRDGQYVQMATGPVPVTGFDSERAHYVQLDRAGVNRLIRALRKARDQAYGRDA